MAQIGCFSFGSPMESGNYLKGNLLPPSSSHHHPSFSLHYQQSTNPSSPLPAPTIIVQEKHLQPQSRRKKRDVGPNSLRGAEWVVDRLPQMPRREIHRALFIFDGSG